MRKKFYELCALCALALPLSATPFAEFISTEADLLVSVRDISEIRDAWEQHPLAEVFADESLQAFFEPVLNAMDESDEPGFAEVMKEEFGLTWEEVFELLPGQAAVALYNLPEMLLQQDQLPDIAIMAEFSGSAERLDELMQIQFERNAQAQKDVNPLVEHEMIEETFMGETLYFDETFDGEETYIEDGYALVDGIFILARPEERMRSLVEAIKLGAEDSLATSTPYQRVREESGRGDLSVYVNLESIMPLLNGALMEQAAGSGLAMFGVSDQSLNAALALEALQAFSAEFDLVGDALMSYSSIVYREKDGLLKLISYADGELPEAPYVPERVLSSAVALFDLSEMLANFESILGTASPTALPLLDIQLQNIKAQTGVDLRTAVLDNFGAEMVTLSVIPEAARGASAMLQPDQLFVLKVNDAEALSGALEALKDVIPAARAQIETLEFEGETIHMMQGMADPTLPDAPATNFSFVITRSHLIVSIGSVGLLQQVLSAMQSQDSGFWQLPETEALFEKIQRPNPITRSYYDLGAIVLPLLHSIAQASQFGGEEMLLDVSKIPDELDVSWHLVTESTEAPDGLFTRSIMLQKEEVE